MNNSHLHGHTDELALRFHTGQCSSNHLQFFPRMCLHCFSASNPLPHSRDDVHPCVDDHTQFGQGCWDQSRSTAPTDTSSEQQCLAHVQCWQG